MEIDFNPQPQTTSLDYLSQGLNSGLNLGLGFQRAKLAQQANAREQQQLEMQKAAAQAQAQLAKEKAEMERGHKGLEELNKFQQYLSPETKTKLLREAIVPLANKTYGLDIDPSVVEYNDKYKNILKLMNEGASKELIKAEYGLLLSSADKESLPIIKEIGEAAGVGQSQISPIDLARMANLETDRSEKRADTDRNRYRQYFLDMEQRDPIIKQINEQGMSSKTLQAMIGLSKDNNTVAFSAVGTKMAKTMGEVGVLTENDVKRYVSSGQLSQKAGDTLSLWLRGRPTDATLDEIKQISSALEDTFTQKLQPRFDRYIEAYSNIEGVQPEDFAKKLSISYGGSSQKTESPKIPTIATQAEYDKLPSGAEYIDSDGVKARKR